MLLSPLRWVCVKMKFGGLFMEFSNEERGEEEGKVTSEERGKEEEKERKVIMREREIVRERKKVVFKKERKFVLMWVVEII